MDRNTVALIVAAGKGERAGGAMPKQFAPLGGMPMVAHSCRAFRQHARISRVIVVIPPGYEALIAAISPDLMTVPGGPSRRESVLAGLEAIAAQGNADHVLIHDAARPMVPAAVIDGLLSALERYDGAVPVLPVADTLVRFNAGAIGDTVPREGAFRVQTPQAFDFAKILKTHRAWPEGRSVTDDAQMMRDAGYVVTSVPGSMLLEKVTYSEDFAAAEARLGYVSRSASGFDVHRFAEGEELWLGGILVPHVTGLSGHSDADVALHAITDALLGTIAAGDIGTHFPPSDPQWRGAASAQFLEHAARLVRDAGGIIDFIDLTIICEAPKIGPHRAAIQARIASILGLSNDQVSVKATTTERLGFTGRGEGMAAQAVATIRLPRADRPC